MRLELLKQLLLAPACSGQEGPLAALITAHVRAGGAGRRGHCWTDPCHNVYVVKGGANPCPCVAAHLDTVHPRPPATVVHAEGRLFGFDARGRRAGLGGDDQAGVYLCLELLERFDQIAAVFFAAEEIGCVGARQAAPAFFDRVGYVVEFDCPGFGLVSHSCGGRQLFANRGEFIQTARPVLERQGAARFQRHPYTDVMAVRERFPLSCLNLSAGYHRWHRPDEYVALAELAAMLTVGEEVIAALGCRRYPFPVGATDPAPPPFEVTALTVLEEPR